MLIVVSLYWIADRPLLLVHADAIDFRTRKVYLNIDIKVHRSSQPRQQLLTTPRQIDL